MIKFPLCLFDFFLSRLKPIPRMKYNYIMCGPADITDTWEYFWIAYKSLLEELVLRVMKNIGNWFLQSAAISVCELSLYFWRQTSSKVELRSM